MTEKKERDERDGEYTDKDPEDVSGPEPEAGEYTDSEIPGE